MPKVGMEAIRKAAVINAAMECICETGIEGITLDMVATKAGCSKGVVAYYFKTKKQLVLETLKAFLSYYQKKIQSEITKEMTPDKMLQTVLAHGLPPLAEKSEEQYKDINVSDLNGIGKMNIPPDKKARLFVQFFSRAVVDSDLQSVIKEVYAKDVAGIASIIDYGVGINTYSKVDSYKAAYGFLALIVGLIFFRVTGFNLQGNEDNRVLSQDYLKNTLKVNRRDFEDQTGYSTV